jgi:hypothetical protein
MLTEIRCPSCKPFIHAARWPRHEEHILATVLRRGESKTFIDVEELDSSLGIEFWSRVKCQSLRQAQKDRHEDNQQM